MTHQERVKVGIIGCGGIAEVHMRHLSQKSCVPELEVVAYTDLVEEKAEQFLNYLNI